MRVIIALILTAFSAGLANTPATANGPLPSADPAKVGFSVERLARIKDALKAEVDKGMIPGAGWAIARRGFLVAFDSVGFLDKEANTPMPTNALFSLASMTKPLASVCLMMLVEEGKVLLSDPVGKYLPALAEMKVGVIKTSSTGEAVVEAVPANRQPTIQDLLRHTSGLTYGNRGTSAIHKLYSVGSSGAATSLSSAEFLTKLAALPLLHQPGTVWEYGLSTDVVGLVVEAVTGKRLGVVLKERLFDPLGMVDTSFDIPEAKRSRYARALAKDPITGKAQTILHASGAPLKFDCGGACAVSTMADYIRFVQFLINKGELDGKRLLGRKTVELMTSDHLGTDIRIVPSDASRAGYGFGLGFAVRKFDGVAALHGSSGDYNWAGAFGTYFWVDPREQLGVVFMSQSSNNAVRYYRQLIATLVLQAMVD